MRHHSVTATFSAPPEEVFAYLANIDTDDTIGPRTPGLVEAW